MRQILEDLDDDGYPTELAIEKIKSWSMFDAVGLLEYIRSIWRYSDCGYWTQTEAENKVTYEISTGGWSGNEELIGALQNTMIWVMSWVSIRRGGHYVLEVRT